MSGNYENGHANCSAMVKDLQDALQAAVFDFNCVKAERDRYKAALEKLLMSIGGYCRLDHSGNCKEHFLENPCVVAEARKALGEA